MKIDKKIKFFDTKKGKVKNPSLLLIKAHNS